MSVEELGAFHVDIFILIISFVCFRSVLKQKCIKVFVRKLLFELLLEARPRFYVYLRSAS